MSEKVTVRPAQNRRMGLLIVSAVAVIAIAGIALYLVFDRLTADRRADSSPVNVVNDQGSGGGTALNPPRVLSDFTLTNQRGEATRLSDFRGQWILLYFGYTHCPDFCPLTLEKFRQVQTMLGDQADGVAFVFVSVDGERDSPEALAKYMEVRRVPDFTALTGDAAALNALGVEYGLYFEKREDPGTQANYLVDHTSASFLIDSEGRLVKIYSFDVTPEVIAGDLQELL